MKAKLLELDVGGQKNAEDNMLLTFSAFKTKRMPSTVREMDSLQAFLDIVGHEFTQQESKEAIQELKAMTADKDPFHKLTPTEPQTEAFEKLMLELSGMKGCK